MAYEQRRLLNNLSGTLAARASATDSQITCQGSAPGVSNVFAALPTDFSSGLYMPLVLANESTGKFEIVWVTGHASASPTLSVVRNREGTDAQTFEVGDVVRCAATTRDLGGLRVTTRSALPGDPHRGMRVTIGDEGIVVERSALGWVDAAPIGPSAKRQHRWSQAGAPCAVGGGVIGGLSGAQTGTAGEIATMASGVAKLNKGGMWSLGLAMYAGNFGARQQGVQMNWPGGGFVLGDNMWQINGQNPGGNALPTITWTGYVTDAQAAIGITCSAYSTVALTNCQYDFAAEYLGS